MKRSKWLYLTTLKHLPHLHVTITLENPQFVKPEDSHIINLLQQNDKGVIEILYDRYASTLYGIVLRIVIDEKIAEDVIQEAFVKIWNKGDQYEQSKGTLFTWMLNITRNTAIDQLRKKKSRGGGKIQSLENNVPIHIAATGSLNPNHIGVREIVEKLDEKYRQIIELAYFHGYTQSEIQEELDIPLGTVKTRLRIALRELRKVFNVDQFLSIILFGLYWFNNFG